jgi:beta-lactamase regulating signal transducer with metallopeptidase domain
MDIVIEQINSAGKTFVEFAWPMLWQASVLIAILLAADWLLRRRVRAVFRYWLWMLVLAKLFLPTTLSSPVSIGLLTGNALPAINIAVTEWPVGGDISNVLPYSPRTAETGVASHTEAPIKSPVVTPAVSLTLQGGIFLVWLMVVCAMLLLLMQRAVFVCGLVRQSAEATGLMKDALKFCCNQMGVRQTIRLKVSPNATSPAVCGLFRPVILVPQGLGSSLGISSLRMVLMHELAHIKRGDLWVNLLQTLLQIVYFYNPLLWLANWVIRRVREQAVDEAVQVALGERANQYPETLLNVARLAFERPALSLRLIGVVESKGALTSRIKRMLTLPIPKTAKLGIIGSLVIIILAAVLLPMAKATPPPEFIIKGTVIDTQTGKPVAGAKVGDAEEYAGGKYGAVTDSEGNYSYKTWYEEHNVKCEASGYKTETKVLMTKALGSEQEKVLDFALGSKDSSDNTDYARAAIKEGVGFDDFIIGDANCTGEFIKSKLGKPEKETKDEQQGWWIAYRQKYGLDFWLNLQKNTLYEIRLNKGFKGKLTSGISMSSTKRDVFKTYGEPIREAAVDDLKTQFDDKVLFSRKDGFAKIHYDDKGLLFWFEEDKINQIRVGAVSSPGGNDTGAKTDVQARQPINFEITSWKFQNGDSIEITDLSGPAGVIRPGQTYTVSGRYTLRSHDYASLHVYATNGEVQSSQGPSIKRGESQFTRTFTLLKEGDLHLSFYPVDGGESFGGVYFAQRGADAGTEAIQIHKVGQAVAEFPEKEDLSTPEAAYAAINRVSASGDAGGWQRVSAKEIAEKLARENKNGKMNVEPEWAKVLLNARILEARICNANTAVAIAKLPQEFSPKEIKKPIDIRYLKLEDGKWLNTGNDRVWTIEEARTQFDSLCEDKKTGSGD